MNTHHRTAVVATSAILMLTACVSNPTREEIGTVTGAVVGGIVGSALTGGNSVGTIGGAAAGGYFGNRIGHNMDRRR